MLLSFERVGSYLGPRLSRRGPFLLFSVLRGGALSCPLAFALGPVLDLVGRQPRQPLLVVFAMAVLPLYFVRRQRERPGGPPSGPSRLTLGASIVLFLQYFQH